MKKILSLVLCILMIATTVTAIAPITAATTEWEGNQGPLAITEVAPGVTGTAVGYDYIEIMNISDSAVDLSDYYIYRYARAHGGTYSAVLSQAILGQNNYAPTQAVKHRLTSTSTIIEKGELAIVWFNCSVTPADPNDRTAEFRTARGVSSDSTILEVQVSSSEQILNYSNIDCGEYLSTKHYSAYSLALVNEDIAVEASVANVKAVHSKASCIVAIVMTSAMTENKSATFGSFYDPATLQTSIDSMSTAAALNKNYSNFYPAIETASTDFPCLAITDGTGTTPLPHFAFVSTPTPGAFDGFQFDMYNNGAGNGALAITEVVASTGDDGEYEYVEIYNSSNSDVILSNYTLLQFAFGHSGTWEGSGFQQIFGSGETAAATHSYAKLSGAKDANGTSVTTLGKGETAILWFNNSSSGKTADDFEAYWTDTQGATAKVGNAVNADMSNLLVVPYSKDVASDRGKGFLADYMYGYTLALYDTANNSDSALSTAYNAAISTNAVTSANRTSVILNSDCATVIYARGKEISNVAANYYGYSGEDSNLIVGQNVNVMYFFNGRGGWTNAWANVTPTSGASNVLFADIVFDSVPTPGVLCNGQFGYKADAAKVELLGYQYTPESNGVTNVRIVGYIDSLNYDSIAIEVMAAVAATDNTSASGSISNATYKSKKTLSSTSVYTSVIGTDENGNNQTYDLTYFKKDSGYIFAIVIENVPTDNVSLLVRCTATNGNTVIGTGFNEFVDFTK